MAAVAAANANRAVRRGPLSTMLESLNTIAWGYVQPHILMDEHGEEVMLNRVDPKTIETS